MVLESEAYDMKRILIATDAWHPQVNGVVTVYEALKTRLEKRGIAVSIIHPGLFPNMSTPIYPEIRLALFPRRIITRLLEEIKPDAVHIATEGPVGYATRAICKSRGLAFTSAYHTHFHLYTEARLHMPMFTPLLSALMCRFHKPAVRTLVSTESMKRDLECRGFRHLYVWPIGVDTDLFSRNENSPIPKFQAPVFLYFGRLAIEKNVDEFFECKLPGTKLVIGDGPDRKRLEKRYGKDAHFVGYKYGKELVNWLSICDVLVFPSDTETTGLVMLEAMACGIPVAAHNVRGPCDIITSGKDGILSNDLAKAAVEALRLDRRACRETAMQYGWERSVEAYLSNLHFLNN